MQKFSSEKWASFVVIAAGGCAVLFLGVKYLFPALLPFLLAWGLAFALRPLSVSLSKRLHIPRRIAAASVSVLCLGALFLVLFLLLRQLFLEGQSLLKWLQSNPERISEFFALVRRALGKLRFLFPNFSETEGAVPDQIEQMLYRGIETVLSKLPQLTLGIIRTLPAVLLFVFVTLIALVYFSMDLETINRRFLALLPPKWAGKAKHAKRVLFSTVVGYTRAYLVLMGITFLMLLAGFALFGIPYALLLSFLLALVDFLPVLGVGACLVPWGLFCLFFGQSSRGVVLLLLYAIVVLVRQFAEPKIVGARLGISPLLTLICLYAGVVILGFWGVIIGPITGVFLSALVSKAKSSP